MTLTSWLHHWPWPFYYQEAFKKPEIINVQFYLNILVSRVNLLRTSTDTMFGGDALNLTLEAEFQSDYRLRIKVSSFSFLKIFRNFLTLPHNLSDNRWHSTMGGSTSDWSTIWWKFGSTLWHHFYKCSRIFVQSSKTIYWNHPVWHVPWRAYIFGSVYPTWN